MDNPVAPTPQESQQVNFIEKRQSFLWNNIVAALFIVAFLITILSQNLALSNAMFFVIMIVGLAAAISFFNRMLKIGRSRSMVVHIFMVIVGFVGAIIILLVSFIEGLGGSLRNSPPIEGD